MIGRHFICSSGVFGMNLLKPVKSQPGRPLYLTTCDAVRKAIDAGIFSPGQRMPSTKKLSAQLRVSLVTTHRALQELVINGVVHRSQGKGTFVQSNYREGKAVSSARVGLIVRTDASLSSYFHSQILEGIRQAAHRSSVDLILHSSSADPCDDCDGFLFLSPSSEQIEIFLALKTHKPALMVGATSRSSEIASFSVDDIALSCAALDHLRKLGHHHIGYVGGYDNLCLGRDRWEAFLQCCHQLNLMPREQHIVRSMSWKLDEREKLALVRLLSAPNRPTAIIATGLELAMNTYQAAATAGLRVPEDLSIIGVDDPGGAPFLNPPLTTMRQPLSQLGENGATALLDLIQRRSSTLTPQQLSGELIVRASTAIPPAARK